MSIRRIFQVVTIAVALALSFGTVSGTAYACDPQTTSGGFC
jgi:hypothetical protein